MAPERRNQIVLAALVVVLAVLLYRIWPSPAGGGGTFPTAAGATRAARATAASARVEAPDVHLDALRAERPKPGDTERNLFRFKPKAALPAAPAPARPAPPPAPSSPPPPQVPPISLKFIGIVEAPEHGQRIAVLSDDRGVYHGREGEIVEGRYRILRIGAESIELSYVDGRGRQTIRMSGS